MGWGTENLPDTASLCCEELNQGQLQHSPCPWIWAFSSEEQDAAAICPGWDEPWCLWGHCGDMGSVICLSQTLFPLLTASKKQRPCNTPLRALPGVCGVCRVLLNIPTPSEAQSPMVLLGCAGPREHGGAGRARKVSKAVGRGSVCAWLSHGGWDSATPHVPERPRGWECSRKSSRDELPLFPGESRNRAEPLFHHCCGQGPDPVPAPSALSGGCKGHSRRTIGQGGCLGTGRGWCGRNLQPRSGLLG